MELDAQLLMLSACDLHRRGLLQGGRQGVIYEAGGDYSINTNCNIYVVDCVRFNPDRNGEVNMFKLLIAVLIVSACFSLGHGLGYGEGYRDGLNDKEEKAPWEE